MKFNVTLQTTCHNAVWGTIWPKICGLRSATLVYSCWRSHFKTMGNSYAVVTASTPLGKLSIRFWNLSHIVKHQSTRPNIILIQFTQKVLDGIEVEALCCARKFIHTKFRQTLWHLPNAKGRCRVETQRAFSQVLPHHWKHQKYQCAATLGFPFTGTRQPIGTGVSTYLSWSVLK